MRPLRSAHMLWRALIVLAASAPENSAWCQSHNTTLTNASQILALPADRAYGSNVLIRGVVTAAQPDAEWGGRFFIQDATAGIFVENISTNQPRPGDLLEVTGMSHPGGYAPIITQPRWTKLGTAPLPAARPAPIEALMTGIEDSQRVEITGIVRAFRSRASITCYEISSGGYRLDVNTPPLEGIDPQTLIGASVRARGTAATFFSGKLRHLLTVTLHVPRAADFIIERTDSRDPFSERVIPLDSLAQYRSDSEPGQRVHVRGVVTYQRPGEDLFLQDATGGMQVKSRLPDKVVPGSVVEAVGFPNFEQYLPVLEDAVFRVTADPGQTPRTTNVNAQELEGGFHHADLVTLQGRVLDSEVRRIAARPGQPAQLQTVLTLQNATTLFSVAMPPRGIIGQPDPVPGGSLVQVTGVCLMKIAEDGKMQSLQILLPHARDLSILEKPGWWTPRRLLLGLAGLFSILLVALSWNIVISRKNATLKSSIREKEEAQIGLRRANERLEERVKERTQQLKLEISARQDAEVQFKAVLNERTRLAQELHDTLEQTLTGVALQMDTAARFARSDKTRETHHLELARNLVTQSQSEVRCSVWDLRSHSPEQIDLAGLLRTISRQLTDGTGIEVQVSSTGEVRPLPEIIEENVLRVAQEALTNVIKHAKATLATIVLHYGEDRVNLKIQDNGVGFVVATQAGPREGHFGLLGMTERTSRLHGNVHVTSAPGHGTTVEANIPTQIEKDDKLVESQEGAQL